MPDTPLNIATEILRECGRLNLQTYATGGGMDYIVRNVGPTHKPVMAVLGVPDDSGASCSGCEAGSPEKLDEPATVTFYVDDEWLTGLTFRFETARAAMEWMTKPQHCRTFGVSL